MMRPTRSAEQPGAYGTMNSLPKTRAELLDISNDEIGTQQEAAMTVGTRKTTRPVIEYYQTQ